MRKRRIAPNGFTYMGVLKALSHMRDGLSAVQVSAVFIWFARWMSYIWYLFDSKFIYLFIYFVFLSIYLSIHFFFFLSVLLSLIPSIFIYFFDNWYEYFYLSILSLARTCLPYLLSYFPFHPPSSFFFLILKFFVLIFFSHSYFLLFN